MPKIIGNFYYCTCFEPLPPVKLCRVGENPQDVYILCKRCKKEIEVKAPIKNIVQIKEVDNKGFANPTEIVCGKCNKAYTETILTSLLTIGGESNLVSYCPCCMHANITEIEVKKSEGKK